MKKKLTSLVRILISFGLLGLLFWVMRDDITDIWQTISGSNPMYLIVAAGFILINVIMLSWRLKVIFLGENLNLTMKEALQLTVIGYFFNNFMPTAVGGDIVKAHYASKHNNESIRSYASVLMDRFIGLYTFMVVAAIALIVDRGRFHLKEVKIVVFLLLLVGLAGFVMVTNRRVAKWMEHFLMKIKMFRLGERLMGIYNVVHDYRNRKDVAIKAFSISIVAQCIYFIVVYLFFLSLGTDVRIGNIFLIMPVVTFVSMVPSVGGLGVREGAIVALFAPITGKEIAFAASLLLLFGLLFISLMGGIVYLWWGLTGAWDRQSKAKGSEEQVDV